MSGHKIVRLNYDISIAMSAEQRESLRRAFAATADVDFPSAPGRAPEHSVVMSGVPIVTRWCGESGERPYSLTFGRTCADPMSDPCEVGDRRFVGVSVPAAHAERIIAYAKRRGWTMVR